ncbi:hypothetical protein L1887_19942 [Cichorium endivia]|nr:hypothetical protein L1887_19942 [Cichorium endivia]
MVEVASTSQKSTDGNFHLNIKKHGKYSVRWKHRSLHFAYRVLTQYFFASSNPTLFLSHHLQRLLSYEQNLSLDLNLKRHSKVFKYLNSDGDSV